MSTLAIEINDAGLVVADANGVRAVEPGYAVVERERILTGTEALRHARLKPRATSNRFWSSLSLDPGSAGVDGVRNAAELAYAQLSDLWRRFAGPEDDAILVVPGYYRPEQLGLLLGVAQECGMPVRAMVDAAVAASARPYPGRQLVYLDSGLHRVSATPLQQGEEVLAEGEQGLAAAGLANVLESLARRAAEVFVLATRFDPFHRAEAEQLLYDRLPGWLARLHVEEEIELELPHDERELRVRLRRDQWLGAAQGFYRAVVHLVAQSREPGRALALQLSDRLAALPGLAGELARLDDAHIETLPPGHAAQAVLAAGLALQPDAGQVKLLKRLPWRAAPAELPAAAERPVEAAPAAERPTHVVYRGIAYRVGQDGIVVGRAQVDGRRTIVVDDQAGGVSREHCEIVLRNGELMLYDLSRYGTFVNEKKVPGEAALRRGDVIRVGSPGAHLQAVIVE
ncbi:MAG TPA: FHA domain-containing protein [Gammaproteobacteria bacterium]